MIINRLSILKIVFLTSLILKRIPDLSFLGAKVGLKADLGNFNKLQLSDWKNPLCFWVKWKQLSPAWELSTWPWWAPIHSHWHAMGSCSLAHKKTLSCLGVCVLILDYLYIMQRRLTAQKPSPWSMCGRYFFFFLVISSNCWVSMVNDFESRRVQMYALFEGKCPIYQAAGYCGEKIRAHYVTFYTMVGIWCWFVGGEGTRGVSILSPGGHSACRGEGRPGCSFLLQGLVFICHLFFP